MTSKPVRMNRIAGAVWLTAILLSILYLWSDWMTAWEHGSLASGQGTVIGRDFVNVYNGGQLVLQGRFSLPYDLAAYSEFQSRMSGGLVKDHLYSYPPISFLYIWFFALFPYAIAYLLWMALTGVAFAFAARPYVARAGASPWLVLVLPGAIMNIWVGHYGFLIGALWLGAWRQLETRPWIAGMLIGLMVVKPHLAILMPVLLIRRRAWSAFAAAALTVVILVAASALLFGVEPWSAWIGHTIGEHAGRLDDVQTFFLTMMPTIAPTLFRLALPPAIVWPVQALAAVLTIALLWLRMPKDPLQAGLAAACATFLVLPFGFIYDMTVVSLAAFLVLRREPARSPITAFAAVLAFLLPLVTIFLNQAHVPLAPVVLAALFMLLLHGQERLPAYRNGPVGELRSS